MPDKLSKVTIYDVAELAGVSVASVSRVLHDVKTVRPDVRERVQHAIKELDYVPSRTAQMLKTHKSRSLLHIVADVTYPMHVTLFRTIRAACEKRGYYTALADAEQDKERVRWFIDQAAASHTDGLIISARMVGKSILQALKDSALPVVFTHDCGQDLFDACYPNPRQGVTLAMNHLLSLGHRRIAYAGGAARNVINRARKAAYLEALEQSGITPDYDLIFEMDETMPAGYRAGVYFTSIQHMPTAICTSSDEIALGIMQVMYEKGLFVPRAISITGENNTLIGSSIRPALTTITDPAESIANLSVELLLSRIEGRYTGPARQEMVDGRQLLIRETTAPLQIVSP